MHGQLMQRIKKDAGSQQFTFLTYSEKTNVSSTPGRDVSKDTEKSATGSINAISTTDQCSGKHDHVFMVAFNESVPVNRPVLDYYQQLIKLNNLGRSSLPANASTNANGAPQNCNIKLKETADTEHASYKNLLLEKREGNGTKPYIVVRATTELQKLITVSFDAEVSIESNPTANQSSRYVQSSSICVNSEPDVDADTRRKLWFWLQEEAREEFERDRNLIPVRNQALTNDSECRLEMQLVKSQASCETYGEHLTDETQQARTKWDIKKVKPNYLKLLSLVEVHATVIVNIAKFDVLSGQQLNDHRTALQLKRKQLEDKLVHECQQSVDLATDRSSNSASALACTRSLLLCRERLRVAKFKACGRKVAEVFVREFSQYGAQIARSNYRKEMNTSTMLDSVAADLCAHLGVPLSRLAKQGFVFDADKSMAYCIFCSAQFDVLRYARHIFNGLKASANDRQPVDLTRLAIEFGKILHTTHEVDCRISCCTLSTLKAHWTRNNGGSAEVFSTQKQESCFFRLQ